VNLRDLLLAAQAKAAPQYAKITAMRGWVYTPFSATVAQLGRTKGYWTKRNDVTGNYRAEHYRIRLSCTT